MIVACTVSYNSSVIIKKTIEALLDQTYPVDRIIVVDNNSMDSEKKRLATYQAKSDKIEFIWLDENVGGAGGFFCGMKYAKEKYSPDWYWLMDDDAYPDNSCLETLLKHVGENERVGFLAPVIWGINLNKHQLYHARVRKRRMYKFKPVATNFLELDDKQHIDVDAFVGTLISKEAVNKCGLPSPGYFIEGDDTDYTFRISRELPCYLIKKAQINHRDLTSPRGINPDGWWKQYYWFRNSILISKNNLRGYQQLLGVLGFIIFGIRQIINLIFDNRYNGYKFFRSKILIRGLVDGLKGKDGKIIDPVKYKQQLERYQNKRKMRL